MANIGLDDDIAVDVTCNMATYHLATIGHRRVYATLAGNVFHALDGETGTGRTGVGPPPHHLDLNCTGSWTHCPHPAHPHTHTLLGGGQQMCTLLVHAPLYGPSTTHPTHHHTTAHPTPTHFAAAARTTRTYATRTRPPHTLHTHYLVVVRSTVWVWSHTHHTAHTHLPTHTHPLHTCTDGLRPAAVVARTHVPLLPAHAPPRHTHTRTRTATAFGRTAYRRAHARTRLHARTRCVAACTLASTVATFG